MPSRPHRGRACRWAARHPRVPYYVGAARRGDSAGALRDPWPRCAVNLPSWWSLSLAPLTGKPGGRDLTMTTWSRMTAEAAKAPHQTATGLW